MNYFKAFSKIFLPLFVFFFFTNNVFAIIQASQTDSSTSMDGVGVNNFMYECVSASFSGTLATVSAYADGRGVSPTAFLNVRPYTSADCTTGAGSQYSVTTNVLVSSSKQLFQEDFTSQSISLTGINSIAVRIDRDGGGYVNPLGTWGDSVGTDYYVVENTTSDNTTTRIELNDPTNGTSTPSRTIDIDFDYYLNSVTHSTSTYQYINFDFVSLAYPDDDVQRVTFSNLDADDYTNVATSTTLNRDGYYLGLLYFTDGVSKVAKSVSVKFNSATTTLVADIPLANPNTLCDSLDGTFDTALCKSMMFLFYPSENSINKFSSISDIFDDKIPFGYYYQFKNKLDEFELSSTTPPSLSFNFGTTTSPAINGTITIFDMDDIDTNFDFSVAWTWMIRFMWVTFGVYVIARTLQIASVI